jgi:hypothetical protein
MLDGPNHAQNFMNRLVTSLLTTVLLSASILLGTEKKTEPSYQQSLSLQGITFRIESKSTNGTSELAVTPNGLKIDNSPIRQRIEGIVKNAEVADLNVDGSPELYVYVTLPGDDARGKVLAWSANKKKSLSEIYVPELAPGDPKLKGYRGRDEFAVVENTLARRFPIYKDGDDDAKPSGGMRQFQYKLAAGEAGWKLRLDKTIDY